MIWYKRKHGLVYFKLLNHTLYPSCSFMLLFICEFWFLIQSSAWILANAHTRRQITYQLMFKSAQLEIIYRKFWWKKALIQSWESLMFRSLQSNFLGGDFTIHGTIVGAVSPKDSSSETWFATSQVVPSFSNQVVYRLSSLWCA